MSKWQPIETAPKDESHILVFGKQFDGKVAVACWDTGAEWWMLDDGENYGIWLQGDEPTHWMPLPPPPPEKDDE